VGMAKPDSSKNEPDNGASYSAYLSSASTIIGNLHFENAARIDGRVDGDIVSMNQLIIGETAEVTARIEAPSVLVLGKVNGEINATERIDIRPPATVLGNVSSPVVVVEEGAALDGHCSVLEKSVEEHKSPKPGAIVPEEPLGDKAEADLVEHAISLFITNRQRADLRAIGYDDASIDKMTLAEAHKILGLV
jgi:cytoskeletal protein CcmA (bactofilin family)